MLLVLLLVVMPCATVVVGEGLPGDADQGETSALRWRLPEAAGLTGIPQEALDAYLSAAGAYDVDWAILAGIGWIECNHGRGNCQRGAVNRCGARGPMQFLGNTWRRGTDPVPSGRCPGSDRFTGNPIGPPIPDGREAEGFATDGNGNGVADPWEWYDAAHAAARMLTHNHIQGDVVAAIRTYNNSGEYVDAVLSKANAYRSAVASLDTTVTGLAAAGGGGAATQATGDRREIIERAYTWLNDRCPDRSPTQIDHERESCGVPYSMNPPYHRSGYRRDCSGYVSMAWGMAQPGATTVTMASTHAVPIDKEELLPGDILLDPDPGGDGHVVLFERWADDDRTSYWGLEQSGGADETVHRVIPYPYFGGSREYSPYRWRELTGG